MGSRRRKKIKRFDAMGDFRRSVWFNDPDVPEEEKVRVRRNIVEQRAKRRIDARRRHSQYLKTPPKSVRGIHRRRNSTWGGANNGTLCMCCLRRAGTYIVRTRERDDGNPQWKEHDYACNRCNSESLVFITSIPRLPRRTASKSTWRKFLTEECKSWLGRSGGIPDDFMDKV